LLTKTNIKIEAIGSGKKIRGRKHKNWRPDLIVLDDIENDENVRTIEQRNKLSNWFKKAVSRAGDSYTDIIYIGTLLHYDSLLANTLKNPSYKAIKYKAVLSWSSSSLWDEWEKRYTDLDNENHEADALAFYKAHEAEMLEGTEVLWKEKNSYYDLMVIKMVMHRLIASYKMSLSILMTVCLTKSGLITTMSMSLTSVLKTLIFAVLWIHLWVKVKNLTTQRLSL